MKSVTKDVFMICLRFLYSGSIAGLNASNVANVLRQADMYQVPALCQACKQKMMDGVSHENCIVIITVRWPGSFGI